MIFKIRSLFLVLLFVSPGSALHAGEIWPDYRGPHHNGHTEAKGLPVKWSETKNVVWKTPLHGRAWSSPVVVDQQVWVTTATQNGKKLSAIAVDLKTGKKLFDQVLFEIDKPQFAHKFNSYASPSPVAEPGRIYLHWGSPGTVCLETKSFKTLWKRPDLKCNHFRGAGSSPLIYKNLLILTMDGSDVQYVIALDKNTGKTVWKTDRSTDYNDLRNGKPFRDGDLRKGYATPLIVPAGGRDLLFSPGAKAAFAYDPMTGKEIWTVRYEEHSSASRTVFGHGMLFFSTGYSKPALLAVRPDGRGDVTDTHVVWQTKDRVPKKPSVVLVDGLIFMIMDQGGVASCLEAETGKVVWKARVGGNYSASLLHVDGKIYAFSEDGPATVFEAAREYKKIAVNKLDEGFMASPAVAGRSLILRTKTHLYRIEKGAGGR